MVTGGLLEVNMEANMESDLAVNFGLVPKPVDSAYRVQCALGA